MQRHALHFASVHVDVLFFLGSWTDRVGHHYKCCLLYTLQVYDFILICAIYLADNKVLALNAFKLGYKKKMKTCMHHAGASTSSCMLELYIRDDNDKRLGFLFYFISLNRQVFSLRWKMCRVSAVLVVEKRRQTVVTLLSGICF